MGHKVRPARDLALSYPLIAILLLLHYKCRNCIVGFTRARPTARSRAFSSASAESRARMPRERPLSAAWARPSASRRIHGGPADAVAAIGSVDTAANAAKRRDDRARSKPPTSSRVRGGPAPAPDAIAGASAHVRTHALAAHGRGSGPTQVRRADRTGRHCKRATAQRASPPRKGQTDVVVAAQVRLADQHPLLRHRPRSLPGSLAATVVILIIGASASVSAAAAAAAAASCGYVCCWCCWCCPCSSCCICTCHHLHLHFTQSIRPPRAPLPTQLRAFS